MGATIKEFFLLIAKKFQSTHPWWVRQLLPNNEEVFSLVSIHAPVMGATAQTELCTCSARVSIHAPVMGATFKHSAIFVACLVSIHAPVMGATPPETLYKVHIVEFQSTHPWWVRLNANSSINIWCFVSIHAPVMGATRLRQCLYIEPRFQSTHPWWVRQQT